MRHTNTHTHTYANFMMCCGRKGRRGENTVKTNNSVKSPVTYDKSQRKLEKHKRKTEERANNPEYPYEQPLPALPPPASSWHSTPPAKYFIASYEGQRNWNATETLTMTSSEKGKENECECDDMRREIFKWHLLTHSLQWGRRKGCRSRGNSLTKLHKIYLNDKAVGRGRGKCTPSGGWA